MVSGCAGGVRDVFAGLTHSQICVHGPFRPVEMNRGRRAMGGRHSWFMPRLQSGEALSLP